MIKVYFINFYLFNPDVFFYMQPEMWQYSVKGKKNYLTYLYVDKPKKKKNSLNNFCLPHLVIAENKHVQ